ncbi:hypothetical protein QN277_020092 [Acacia crassicarpa]|uniref:Uncharacterized protein n=1 Tax=Acacia crassicarpa TaxID=499986 RepID=A0AAE1MNZ7_9FABA|nr:hypothetical protein QN277_020092 [Acacia crassicarpa]
MHSQHDDDGDSNIDDDDTGEFEEDHHHLRFGPLILGFWLGTQFAGVLFLGTAMMHFLSDAIRENISSPYCWLVQAI